MTFTALWKTITGQNWGPASLGTTLITVVGVVVGGVMTITNPHLLPFTTYLQDLGILGGANGLLAVGRGLHLGALANQLGLKNSTLGQIEAFGNAAAALLPSPVGADVATAVADATEVLNPPIVDPVPAEVVPDPAPAA